MRRMAFVQHSWCFHFFLHLTASVVLPLCSGAFWFQDTQPTTHDLSLDTPDLAKVMRSASPSYLACAHPASWVDYVLNPLLSRCVPDNRRANALHLSDQKFELVHQTQYNRPREAGQQ